jgi:hypothetical protein
MTSAGAAPAHAVTVIQTLTMLDGDFAPIARAVAEGSCAFWLGSGISRSRVDGLREVLERVLAFLQTRIDPTDPGCPSRAALDQAVSYAGLTAAERLRINLDTPVQSWTALPTILDRLSESYSRVLDIQVSGQPEDYLVWEAVDVVSTFADLGVFPDCEHLCVAILAIEGVLPNIVTANWDGLIEQAVEELTDRKNGVVQVCVRQMTSLPPHRARES